MTGPETAVLDAAPIDAALHDLAEALGADHVLRGDALDDYVDPYGFITEVTKRPAAAVRPASVEQVQQVVRLANQHRLALWPY